MTTTQSSTYDAIALRQHKRWQRLRLYLVLGLLMAPSLLLMFVLDYYPKLDSIKYCLYTWNGSTVKEFVGFKNFRDAWYDPIFWRSFQLVFILLIANFVKMWPSIFVAVIMHRLRNERWQYIYRVLLVVPMVIPPLVMLLIWKMFFNPNVGVLNAFLNSTGLMWGLRWLDVAMPAAAEAARPGLDLIVNGPVGNTWGLIIFGGMLLTAGAGWRSIARRWVVWVLLLAAGLWAWDGQGWRLAVTPVMAVAAAELLRLKLKAEGQWAAARLGVIVIVAAVILVACTGVWTRPTQAFNSDSPGWLSWSTLVIPSVIFWGFPWVGTMGVLLYLAGLQNIPLEVYEAAELDGVGPIGRLFYIELPMIMTQVRINMIFLTIGTLTDYGMFLLLLGPEGGPNNLGMVPGLWMYSQAFGWMRFGYACALGMVLFVIVMAITIVYHHYLKVEK